MAQNGGQDEPDWVTLNKKFKLKAALWAGSKPCPRLVLLTTTITAVQHLMVPFLTMSGEGWEVNQRQRLMKGAAFRHFKEQKL